MSTGKRLRSTFKPAWWLGNPHLQTLWPYLFRRRSTLSCHTERLELADGDFVDLCWIGKNTGPIVAVFHGLEGSIHSPYATAIMSAINQRGWRGVFMHFRGCSETPNRLERAYHSGETTDIEYLIRTLRSRYPDTLVGIVGYSLGGNAMLKYLGTAGSRAGVDAAVAVSVPYLLHESARRLSQGFSQVYQFHLVRSLKNKIRRKFATNPERFDMDRLADLHTFYQFDDAITAPLHGFAGVDDYYNQSSSRQYLPGIRVPTLLIHAEDDPFMTLASIPDENELPENVMLELSTGGGHVGFIGGQIPGIAEYWLEQRIINYLDLYLT